jgi:site-specific recombinase XerD
MVATAAPRLLDQVREAVRLRHFSRRTEQAYAAWVARFVRHHGRRHPQLMGADEVREFLSSLAVRDRVSASTQNQAAAALLFLYRAVLRQPLDGVDGLGQALRGVVRAKAPHRLPVVLTRDEVRAVLDRMTGTPRLVGLMLYGSGLRLLECL